MSTNDITSQGRQIRFVLDRSFLNDSFRADYPKNESAKWLYPYFLHRVAHAKTKVCVISSTSIERWSREFRTYPGLTPKAVLAVEAIADIIALADTSIRLDDSTLIVAKVIRDGGTIPVILSSVKASKWKERMQNLGIKLGLEEFEEGMSDKRLDEHMWCAPMSAESCVALMKHFDPLFGQIVKEIGYPVSQAAFPIGQKNPEII